MKQYNRTIDKSGRVVEWEDLRLSLRPKNMPIKLLMVGESPPNPNTGNFFYKGGPLTWVIKDGKIQCERDSALVARPTDWCEKGEMVPGPAPGRI